MLRCPPVNDKTLIIIPTYNERENLERIVAAIFAVVPTANILVIDDDLSPRQQRALEDRFDRRVLDRTAVILDIFALHAHTAEGKLQVELAQLESNPQ